MWEWDSRSVRPKKAGYNRPNALIWVYLSGILDLMLACVSIHLLGEIGLNSDLHIMSLRSQNFPGTMKRKEFRDLGRQKCW